MRYTSTRNSNGIIDCSFEEALTSGYASDGGLFVPAGGALPRLPPLSELAHLTYPQLLYTILRLFIYEQEVSNDELRTVCDSALTGFANADQAVPIVPLEECDEHTHATNSGLYIAELYHGPTFCFKDLGMRAVIGLLNLFCTKRQQRITLVVSTTGDTGPAALRAVADLPQPSLLKIVVHYPAGQISDLQRRQMTTIAEHNDNVRVVAFEGGGDDMDAPIKKLTTTQTKAEADPASPPAPLRTGVNSYNIGRPLAQTVHYVWTYLRIAEREQWDLNLPATTNNSLPKLDFILPTGAMGNVAAGYVAQRMGLPIRKFVLAVNVNDITHRVIQTGAFHAHGVMHKTLSDAINIQVPYNMERLLYYLTDGDHQQVATWYEQGMRKNSSCSGGSGGLQIDLEEPWLSKLQSFFDSARVTDDGMCEAMRKAQTTFHYLADPHTAVALAAAEQLGYLYHNNKNTNTAVATALLATASPCKFEHSVTEAVGPAAWLEYANSNDFPAAAKALLQQPERAPIRYPAVSSDLNETQRHWEELLKNVVDELEGDA